MFADILVIGVTLVSAVISFLRGFIREILTIIGVVGGLLSAIFLGPVFAPMVDGWFGVNTETNGEEEESSGKLFDLIPMDLVSDIVNYGGIFIIVVIVLSVLSHFLASGAKAIGLGPLDRTLGVVFGVVRAVILLGLLFLPVHLFFDDKTKEEYFSKSATYIYIEKTSAFMASFLPGQEKIQKKTESEIEKRLKDLEILKKDTQSENKTTNQFQNNAIKKSKENGDQGYNENQREDLDKLFEQNPAFNE